MICQLTGCIAHKSENRVLIDVNGVGYEVEVTLGTFFELPDKGEAVTLCTHFVVREDAMLLYGFRDTRERSLFRELIKISGIGPKVALGILSSIEADTLIACIRSANSKMLTQIPGIGKKTAERLIVELQDRCQQWEGEAITEAIEDIDQSSTAIDEAEAVLIALGYNAASARRMVKNSFQKLRSKQEPISAQMLIKSALRETVEGSK